MKQYTKSSCLETIQPLEFCWILLLLLIFCSKAFGAFEDRMDPGQKMDYGATAFKNGQFQKSIDRWRGAAEHYRAMGDDGVEGYLRASINLAAAYRSLEAHEEADQLLNEAFERAVQDGIANLVLPLFLLSDHNVFEVDPEGNQHMLSGLVAFNNGWFLESIQHWEKAVKLYDRADSGEEASSRVHFYLGLVYERFGDELKKERMLSEALIRLEQKDVPNSTLLAILSFDQEAYAVDQAAHVAMIKGLVAFRDGYFDESIIYWEEAIVSYEASVGEDFEGIDNLRAFLAMAYEVTGGNEMLVQKPEILEEHEPLRQAVLPVSSSDSEAPVSKYSADVLMSEGLAAFNDGQYAESIRLWQQAIVLYNRSDETTEGSVRARINLAAVYKLIGEHKRAKQTLQEALAYAEQNKSAKGIVLAKSALGASSKFSRQALPPKVLLLESLVLAVEADDMISAAYVLNNLGNLYAVHGNYEMALQAFSDCKELADKHGNTLLSLKAALNKAFCLLDKGDHAAAKIETERLADTIRSSLESGYDKTYLLIIVGHLYSQLAEQAEPVAMDLLLEANATFQEAREDAVQLGNSFLLSYADGYTGRIYELAGRYKEALIATRSAEFYAQEDQVLEALYLWQWQKGRLFAAREYTTASTGAYRNSLYTTASIEAYRSSLRTLQKIRHDLAIAFGNSNRKSSFCQELGSLFYELAGLLVEQSNQVASEAEIQSDLLEARNTIELLKSAELEEYFRDDCVNLIRSKTAGVDAVLKKAAVVYFIPLEDRTELLLTLPSGLKHYSVPVDSEALSEGVAAFRNRLVIHTHHKYKSPAQKLYDWLIRPMEADLEAEGVETLVFVPDGALSTIPMGALYDGKQFLVEKYAVAITPGLTLMNPQPIPRDDIQVLFNGLSESLHGFPALPSVPYEVAGIEKNYASTSFIDEKFLIEPVTEAFKRAPYGIVHIASHSQFGSEAKDTFLLTYEGKLTLDGLEQLIRPSQLRGNPVELLTLSASQTAVGDDRAALGLAGVAVKVGARSAMATLWFVSDEASAKMVTSFYAHLKDPDTSKAMALREAQLELIDDPRFRHPRYWSPYLIIGNWL